MKKNFYINIALLGFILLFTYDFLIYFTDKDYIVIYKTVYFLLLIFIILISNLSGLNRSNEQNNFWFQYLFFIFVILYLIRLIFDLYIFEIINLTYKSPITYLIIFVFSTFIAWYMIKNVDFNYKTVSQTSLIVGFVYFILSFYSIYNNFSIDIRVDAADSIDSIAFGHMGVIVLAISLHLFLNLNNKYWKLFSLFFLTLGILVVVLSASKGPFLAALVVFILFSFYSKIKSFFLIGFILLINYIYPFLNFINSTLFFERVLSTENYSDEGRNILLAQGLNDFYKNPILGSSFLLSDGEFKGEYVHNIILESFMATGFFGGIVFLIMLFISLKHVVELLSVSKIYFFYSMFFLDSLIYGFFSRSLVNLTPFWISIITIFFLHKSMSDIKAN
jgi:hypothetical protein